MSCLFCEIVAGRIPARVAYQDDGVLAFHDINPQGPIHLLVIPKRHITSVLDLTPADDELVLISGLPPIRAKKLRERHALHSVSIPRNSRCL